MSAPGSPQGEFRKAQHAGSPANAALHRVRLGEGVARKLRDFHLAPGKRVEACATCLGHGHVAIDGAVTLVFTDPDAVMLFADDCYDQQGSHHVALARQVAAHRNHRLVVGGFNARLDVHDHHFTDRAVFSRTDDASDRAEARNDALAIHALLPGPQPLLTGSLLVTRGDWAARLVHGPAGARCLAPMRVDQVGVHYQCLGGGRPAAPPADWQRRHHGIIGPAAQRDLAGLRVALVGLGGLGSVAAEALLRIGVPGLTLIDHDPVESSNLNRLQGAGRADVGRLKVDVAADRLRTLFPEAGPAIRRVPTDVFSPQALAELEQADLVMGCLDNGETRWWLHRFCVQYGLPYFDAGVLVATQPALVLYSRVSTIVPGAGPCGHCSPIEFFARNRPPRFMDRGTLAALRQAGYLQGAPRAADADPSIYPLNLQTAAWLVQNLLDWVSADRQVAHSVFHRSDQARIERIALAAFDGLRPDDCPVCQVLTGHCRSVALPHDDPEPIDLPTRSQPLHHQEFDHGLSQA